MGKWEYLVRFMLQLELDYNWKWNEYYEIRKYEWCWKSRQKNSSISIVPPSLSLSLHTLFSICSDFESFNCKLITLQWVLGVSDVSGVCLSLLYKANNSFYIFFFRLLSQNAKFPISRDLLGGGNVFFQQITTTETRRRLLIFRIILSSTMRNKWIKIKYGQVLAAQASNKYKCHVLCMWPLLNSYTLRYM